MQKLFTVTWLVDGIETEISAGGEFPLFQSQEQAESYAADLKKQHGIGDEVKCLIKEVEPHGMHASSPEVDWSLLVLVHAANKLAGSAIPITVMIGGTIITGDLIGGADYYSYLKDKVAPVFGAQNTSRLEEVFGLFSRPYKEDQHKYDITTIRYFHLKNAQVLSPGGPSVPSLAGMLWRGKLTSVDAFTMGRR